LRDGLRGRQERVDDVVADEGNGTCVPLFAGPLVENAGAAAAPFVVLNYVFSRGAIVCLCQCGVRI
jgi:hypothetical protein